METVSNYLNDANLKRDTKHKAWALSMEHKHGALSMGTKHEAQAQGTKYENTRFSQLPIWKVKFLCAGQCTNKTMETIESKHSADMSGAQPFSFHWGPLGRRPRPVADFV